MIRISELRHGPLELEALELPPWRPHCFVGSNGSGKTLFASLLAGLVEPARGVVEVPARCQLISAAASQARYERELREDETDLIDEVDFGTTGLSLLLESGCSRSEAERLARELGLSSLLERGCRQFSSGEWRRIELARALLFAPGILILDEPLEALDQSARHEVLGLLERLTLRGVQLIFFVSRLEDIPDFVSELSVLDRGRLVRSGARAELLADPSITALFTGSVRDFADLHDLRRTRVSPLVRARSLSVRYGDQVQFAPFDWNVEEGDHTRIVGPNGSGKSTLLALLTGDHPQCYSNDLTVCGYKRGAGESIWDVKRRIGFVSPALHRDYRAPATALSVVVSGFFDSIGLYQEPLRDQLRLVERFLELFALRSVAHRPFSQLSHGEQRLVLMARALVKNPPLLILDEPTSGLDAANALLVLGAIERLIEFAMTTVLFVSHRSDEHVHGMNRLLEFSPSSGYDTRFEVRLRSVRGREVGAGEPLRTR